MAIEFGPQLFAFMGVMLTILVGWLSLQRQIASEIKKVQYGVLSVYANKLIKSRLAAYPAIYRLLSDTNKLIESGAANLDLFEFERQFKALDSHHGLLFTTESGRWAQFLRENLRNVTSGPASILSAAELSKLQKILIGLEVALRVDIGVSSLEYANVDPGFQRYRDQSEAATDRLQEEQIKLILRPRP